MSGHGPSNTGAVPHGVGPTEFSPFGDHEARTFAGGESRDSSIETAESGGRSSATLDLASDEDRDARDVAGLGEKIGGGSRSASATSQRVRDFARRVRQSVWLPVLFKAVGVALGMALLAGIGCYSIASGIGVRVPLDGELGKEVNGAWLNVPNLSRPKDSGHVVAAASVARLANHAEARSRRTAREPTIVASSLAVTDDGKVILNLASEADLMRLPGVGKKRAQAILALREKLGGKFKRTTDLLRVRGIGMKFYKRILPHIVLNPPVQPVGRTAIAREAATKL